MSADIPEPKQITVQKIHRNNGEFLDGLVILEGDVNISPTIYLDYYYRSFQDGSSFQTVYSQILSSYARNRTQHCIDVTFFTDFERIRSRIVMKLIHREKNMGQLQEKVPHIPFLDLAIVFSCRFPVDPEIGNATVLVDASHLAMWGITAGDLLPIAAENSKRLLPAKLTGINQVLRDLLPVSAYPATPVEEDPLFPMYVLSNEENLFGAACLAYDGLLRSVSDRFQSDLYILPSSIHEVLLVPGAQNTRMEAFSEMVREVNETQVAPEDVLSDHAYYYSRERDEILY